MLKKHPIFFILLLYSLIAIITLVFCKGTGDAGDSIQHYLFARYAPVHPALFFDHWAKPVYVLLAFPFAQAGFTGIKIFNVIVVLFTLYFTYKIAEILKLKNPALAPLILVFIPTYYVQTFSGLTEPLFALFLVLGIYLCLEKKYLAAAILMSFLPFVRSEGWILLFVFALYFILKKQWKSLPYLLAGDLFYSLAGSFIYHDLFWVFTQNPYASLSSTYGSGGLFHYVFELYNATGVPVYLLFWTGFLYMIWKMMIKKLVPEETVLIFLGFTSYFIAHSLFWYFGIFNSMGLKRVLVGILPLLALISLYGLNYFSEELSGGKGWIRQSVLSIFLLYLVVFPFTYNPAAVNWKKNMQLNENQKLATTVAQFIRSENLAAGRYYFEHPYLNLALDVDPFNTAVRSNLTQGSLEHLKPWDIVIWDNWFAVTENKIGREYLETIPGLTLMKTFPPGEINDRVVYAVYQMK